MTADTVHDSVASGDRAAAEGDWVTAIAAWHNAIATGDNRGEERIGWFLRESNAIHQGDHSLPWRCVALATMLAVVGTVLVLIAEHVERVARILLVVPAWVSFITAGVIVVRIARAVGTRDHPARPLTSVDIERARDHAAMLLQ